MFGSRANFSLQPDRHPFICCIHSFCSLADGPTSRVFSRPAVVSLDVSRAPFTRSDHPVLDIITSPTRTYDAHAQFSKWACRRSKEISTHSVWIYHDLGQEEGYVDTARLAMQTRLGVITSAIVRLEFPIHSRSGWTFRC